MIHDRALAHQQPGLTQMRLNFREQPVGDLVLLQQPRNFRIEVSSGMTSASVRTPANWRIVNGS